MFKDTFINKFERAKDEFLKTHSQKDLKIVLEYLEILSKQMEEK